MSIKTIEELGISPTPWTNKIGTENGFELNSVWDAKNGGVLTGGYGESVNDARLIAAAPNLYEELWRQCFGKTGTPNCLNCVGPKFGKCHDCPLGGARAALAKAAGEGEE